MMNCVKLKAQSVLTKYSLVLSHPGDFKEMWEVDISNFKHHNTVTIHIHEIQENAETSTAGICWMDAQLTPQEEASNFRSAVKEAEKLTGGV